MTADSEDTVQSLNCCMAQLLNGGIGQFEFHLKPSVQSEHRWTLNSVFKISSSKHHSFDENSVMKLVKQLACVVLTAASLFVVSPCEALAQGAQMQVQMNAFFNGGGVLSTTTAEQMGLFLDLQIEKMQTTCDLSDGQSKKLRLAGKSVAKKLFSAEGMQLQFGGLFGRNKQQEKIDEDSLSDEDAEPDAKDEDQGQLGQKFKIKRPVSLDQVTKHSLWKKAVQSVLSEKQQTAWKQSEERQAKATRHLVVSYRTAELTQQLLLSPNQVPAVEEVVDRIEGNQLVRDFKTGQQKHVRIVRRNKQRAQVSASDLKEVLTPLQMKVFKNPSSPSTDSGIQALLGQALGMQPKNARSKATDMGIEFMDSGLKVKTVANNSPAASIGIQVGDVVDSVDGEPVDTELQFQAAIKRSKENPSITVLRNSTEVQLEQK